MREWLPEDDLVLWSWTRWPPWTLLSSAAAIGPCASTSSNRPAQPARCGGIALWDGTEVLFVGGYATTGYTPAARGLAYSPAANRWRVLPARHYARSGFAAVWTGHQALVWGGLIVTAPARVPPPHGDADGPATNRWTALPQSPLPGRGAGLPGRGTGLTSRCASPVLGDATDPHRDKC